MAPYNDGTDWVPMIRPALRRFELLHLRFTMAAVERVMLPRRNKGITLRGAFGATFRSIACVNRAWSCESCPVGLSCAYGLLFSPTVPEESERLRLNKDIPRPFVIKPPTDHREAFEPGEAFSFELVLVGRACEFFPYFFLCFQEMGRRGLGPSRGRCELVRMGFLNEAGEATIGFEAGGSIVKAADARIGFTAIARKASAMSRPGPQSVRVKFITPVLLKDGGSWTPPRFGPLMRRLRDRINALSYFYCDELMDMDFSSFGEAAEEIQSSLGRMHWVEERRASKHRGIEYPLKGYVGAAVYSGELERFLPFLLLGEYIHAGKAATFGQGWYQIEEIRSGEIS